MEKKRSVRGIIIGITAIVLGVWNFSKDWGSTSYTLCHPSLFIESWGISGIYMYILTIFVTLTAICFVAGGIALLYLKEQGKQLIRISLLIEIPFRLMGIINFWHSWFIMNPYFNSLAVSKSDMIIKTSMIPTYIKFIIEIIVFFYLTRPTVKEQAK